MTPACLTTPRGPVCVDVRVVFERDAAGRPMTRVVAVLQVYLRLPDEVIDADQVPVVHLDGEHRVHREARLDLETPGDSRAH